MVLLFKKICFAISLGLPALVVILLARAISYQCGSVMYINRTSVDLRSINCLNSLQEANLFESTNCPVSTVKRNGAKKFAYLTQTEGCLNDYLKSTEVWGDSSSCQCDVLVLSYKQKCTDKSKPHIQYIFNSSTTWTTGRNLLYETIISRERDYLYYTFLDDDAVLRFRNGSQREESPWREYEKNLLEVEPLVGVSWGEKTEAIFYRYYRGCCVYPQDTKFLPFVWFDAMFNSFHRKVICHLLPYNDMFDRTSWWHSQVYLIMKTDLMFPGQVQIHLNVLADNPVHRPYPRKDFSADMIKTFINVLRQEIPKQYIKLLEPRIRDWLANGYLKEHNYPTLCSDLPLQYGRIVPYAYHLCRL